MHLIGMLNISNKIESLDLSLNGFKNFFLPSSCRNLKVLSLEKLELPTENEAIELKSFPNITFLDLSDNKFGLFNLTDIYDYVKIKNLDLSNMKIDESFEEFKFAAESQISFLNLSRNLIRRIRTKTFRNARVIQSIDLSYNLIEFIERESFLLINTLQIVNLKSNLIKTLDFASSSIFYLDLSENKIDVFEGQGVTYLDHLMQYVSSLDLNSNCIVSLDLSKYFNAYNYLIHINLGANKLVKLADYEFRYLKKLVSLDLRQNKIELIEKLAFANLDALESLFLQQNKLKFVEETIFRGLFQLKYLNISGNRIENINSSLFTDLVNLLELDLSSNAIKTIEINSFSKQVALKRLFLNSNDEHLRFMTSAFRGLKSVTYIFIDFRVLNNSENRRPLIESIETTVSKLGYEVYFRTVRIEYEGKEINCLLVLEYSSINVQVNLKTDAQFNEFMSKCGDLNLQLLNYSYE